MFLYEFIEIHMCIGCFYSKVNIENYRKIYEFIEGLLLNCLEITEKALCGYVMSCWGIIQSCSNVDKSILFICCHNGILPQVHKINFKGWVYFKMSKYYYVV